MRIRIVSRPPGEAPPSVRDEWIGLILDVPSAYARKVRIRGLGVLSAPRSRFLQMLAILFGRGARDEGYVVEAAAAVDALAQKSPVAADWWRRNVPHLIEPGRHFLFSASCCEEIR